MSDDEKVRENRLRRMAERQGLRLEKARRRDPRAYDYGTYQLIEPDRNLLVFGDHNRGYGLSLDEVELCLTRDTDKSNSPAFHPVPAQSAGTLPHSTPMRRSL